VGVLVGITILSIALAAQIRLLGNTIKRDAELRSLIIGTNLAREGIEILFSWRVTRGWGGLQAWKNDTLCADIRLSPIIGNSCTFGQLKIANYPNRNDFKAYLYGVSSADFDAPAFTRAMTVKSCDPVHPENDDKCLVLVATAGWDTCSAANWQKCAGLAAGDCPCKLVKLEKKIYNWYVP